LNAKKCFDFHPYVYTYEMVKGLIQMFANYFLDLLPPHNPQNMLNLFLPQENSKDESRDRNNKLERKKKKKKKGEKVA
jgi:hypothetical protein